MCTAHNCELTFDQIQVKIRVESEAKIGEKALEGRVTTFCSNKFLFFGGKLFKVLKLFCTRVVC